jgi:hypothetical protein
MPPTLPTNVEWSPMIDELPCDTCPNIARCRKHSEACESFRDFVRYGGKRWRSAPREPSADIYQKLFRETGDELIAA